jgi:hypothetical protein
VNLNLRRLPDPAAEVVARVPGGTALIIIERTQVTLESGIGVPESPDWFFVEYEAGGVKVTGWISGQYVILSRGGRALPIEEIPIADEIIPGEGNLDGAVIPPTQNTDPFASLIVGTLSTTGNLNLRATPSAEAQVLLSIPAGSVVTVLGRNGDGVWLNVRYEVAGGSATTGWVQASFVTVTQGGAPYQIRNLNITNGEVNTMP